jgi:uncharacterized membrane protein
MIPPVILVVLMALSFACFVLATFPAANPYWQRLVTAGLAIWSLVALVGVGGLVGK